jgi:predicted dithiol-disulfide oxidoreductase (DUF899 family)
MAGSPEAHGTTLHDKRFPNESAAYRQARNQLLSAERALRRQMEEVAALRRQLPLGGVVPEDYRFEEGPADLGQAGPVRTVKLSELFVRGSTLVLYSFMYGPAASQPCPMCTSMLDGLNGSAPHILQRTNLAVVAKSAIQRVRAFALERGWRNLRLLSSHGNSYNQDYHGEGADGAQWPALNVFVQRGGQVLHAYSTELLFMPSESGQNSRHVDLLWPLWNLLDLTPEGRGSDWYPKLHYPAG